MFKSNSIASFLEIRVLRLRVREKMLFGKFVRGTKGRKIKKVDGQKFGKAFFRKPVFCFLVVSIPAVTSEVPLKLGWG